MGYGAGSTRTSQMENRTCLWSLVAALAPWTIGCIATIDALGRLRLLPLLSSCTALPRLPT